MSRVFGAALFLSTIAALLNSPGLGVGVRDVLTGVIIISVIIVAGGRSHAR
jgi:ribose transport system permease protein